MASSTPVASPSQAPPSSNNKSQTMATQTRPKITIPKHLITALNSALVDLNTHLLSKTILDSFDPSLVETSLLVEKTLLTNILTSKDRMKAILNPKPLTTFPKFSNLPLELRIMIWKLAGSEGKVIGVRAVKFKGDLRLAGTEARCPLLLVCKESREEALRAKDNFSISEIGAPKIYANFGVDTIWIQGVECFSDKAFQKQVCKIVGAGCMGSGVQRIAIHVQVMSEWRMYSFQVAEEPEMDFVFEASLKSLILVLEETRENTSGLGVGIADPAQSLESYFSGLSHDMRSKMFSHARYSSPYTTVTWQGLTLRDQRSLRGSSRSRHRYWKLATGTTTASIAHVLHTKANAENSQARPHGTSCLD
ncbi:hypothetical protein VTL71DRAFT_4029 [Oculimacula yallundae]|uniref:2EXR domain-containing protein n=1 Tax=Oculimacula yallundae TaxID=86028 RepID=A0ABR4C4Q5_9HELO